MQTGKINNYGKARLFESPNLEKLTKAHPLVIWAIYLPVIILMTNRLAAKGSVSAASVIVFFAAGVFFWTLTEYVLHRFVFHQEPETETGRKIVYLIHGNHHEFPRDKERLFMPPIPSIILASCFFIVFYLLIDRYALAFFPGFMSGYLLYGTMHYAIHAWNPPFKWMKPLWRNHHLHHYKHQDLGFGVSSTLWDRVFGTMYDMKKEKVDEEKVKELKF